ncbi:MAG TPA: MarR family transcriptional regulator [Streptosporangiaceae bacterium]|nr:MarR family transcriptional regulator [Streptosporangiaceae bacterium]
MKEDTAQAYRLLMAEVYELAGRSRGTSAAIARRYAQTAAGWHVLSVLEDSDVTVPGIARRLGQARQSVQRVAGGLLAAGLVQAVANPDHQRSPLLRLTGDGRRLLRTLNQDAAADRTARLAAAGLTTGQLDQARHVLRRLIGALGE